MTDKTQHPQRMEDLLASRQDFLQIFKRGAEFTEDLLKENERLRFHVADLEGRQGRGDANDEGLVKELMERIRRIEAERDQLVQRFAAIEAQSRDFASRYANIESENNSLMSIYVASYQLHSTLEFEEVLMIITEIILNFVGAEVFSVGMVDEATGKMLPLVTEGIDPVVAGQVLIAEGIVGDVVRTGTSHFSNDLEVDRIDPAAPRVCIPLKIKDKVIGLLVVYRFFPQKKSIVHLDHELFTLLAGHAATAIFSAKLYSDSRRKLNTIQGLIDLVTS